MGALTSGRSGLGRGGWRCPGRLERREQASLLLGHTANAAHAMRGRGDAAGTRDWRSSGGRRLQRRFPGDGGGAPRGAGESHRIQRLAARGGSGVCPRTSWRRPAADPVIGGHGGPVGESEGLRERGIEREPEEQGEEREGRSSGLAPVLLQQGLMVAVTG